MRELETKLRSIKLFLVMGRASRRGAIYEVVNALNV